MVLSAPEPVTTAALAISSFAGGGAVATAAGAAAKVGLDCFKDEREGEAGDEHSSPILDVPREGLVGSDDEEEEGGEGTKDVGEDGRGGWLAFEAPDAPGEGDVAVVDQDGVHAEDDEAELGKVGNGTDEVGVCVGVVDREHGCQVDAGAGGEEARFDRKWEGDAEVFFPGDHFPLGVAEALLGGGDTVKDTPVVQGQGDEQCTG
eukprot:evm.model.NODE_18966_length_14284_cov_21.081699.1